ncbi:hypothetical protein B0T14DRAFT_562925 [Immersiella caudata]|uniref:Ubiquitin-like protease family profile domain-containing protein n=1 Tax=Immersiella caudata TaxID=314043 RepID=A0AA40C6L8_9PEZI|nr:hypothetical protein B0T14DRAFT_562925 [Immersiella caudata]
MFAVGKSELDQFRGKLHMPTKPHLASKALLVLGLGHQDAVDQMLQEFDDLLREYGLTDEHCLMANGAIDVSRDSLQRLGSGEWLDAWVIAAAMELTAKPLPVRIGLSVPLHEGKNKIKPREKPLAAWRKKVDASRAEELAYFCPLHLRNDHFTLLEIDEGTQTIYHYDSLAQQRRTLVGNAVEEEFKHHRPGGRHRPDIMDRRREIPHSWRGRRLVRHTRELRCFDFLLKTPKSGGNIQEISVP